MVVLQSNSPWKWCIQKCHHIAWNAFTSGHQCLSRHMRAHTYIKWNRSGFWYPYSFESMGVSTFPNPNKSICKIWIINSIKAKFCKVALTSTMCTSVHMSLHSVMWVSMRSICMPCMVCMHIMSMFLAKHEFQTCMVHDTMARSGAQTINTLL